MAEQEMDLDTAISLFRLVMNFEEYREGLRQVLTRCHTREELDKAKIVIEEEKNRLLETNEEFRTIMDQRKQDAKMRAEESRAMHKAKMAEIGADADRIRSEAMAKADATRMDVENWVSERRIKTRTFDEAQKIVDDKLGCPNPKCEEYGKNRGNVMNNIPTCMRCFHKLVPKSEYKDYNRKYWRRYNKKKKRKRK